MVQVYKSKNGGGTFGNSLIMKASDVSGLACELYAGTGMTLVSGTRVSGWADQSGNARNFAQGTAANRPAYSATGGPRNQPYVSGNGSNYLLTSTYTPGAAGTAILVARNTRANPAGPTGQIDTLLSASNTTFNGVRLESYNYYNDPNQRYIAGSAATGTIEPDKNGFEIGGLFSSTYLALNEWAIISLTWSGVSANMGACRLFATADSGLFALNDIAAMLIYNTALSEANRRYAEAYLSWRYALQHYETSNFVLVCSGDSITRGYGLDLDGSWPYQLYWNLRKGNSGIFMYNEAVDGSTLLDIDSRAAAAGGIDTLTFGAHGTGARPKVVLFLWGGTNDIYVLGDTPATAFARLRVNIQNRKATGKYDAICIGTMIPRGSGTSGWSDFNTLVTTNWATLVADGAHPLGLSDYTQDAPFSTSTSPNDPTYYNPDLTHLTNAGEAGIATRNDITLEAVLAA